MHRCDRRVSGQRRLAPLFGGRECGGSHVKQRRTRQRPDRCYYLGGQAETLIITTRGSGRRLACRAGASMYLADVEVAVSAEYLVVSVLEQTVCRRVEYDSNVSDRGRCAGCPAHSFRPKNMTNARTNFITRENTIKH